MERKKQNMTGKKFYIGFVLDNENGIRYSMVSSHKLIAQMDGIVNMLSIGEDKNLRDKVKSFVFDTEAEKVIIGFKTNTVDEFLVEVNPIEFPDIKIEHLARDLFIRRIYEEIENSDGEDEEEFDSRIGAQVNIFTA